MEQYPPEIKKMLFETETCLNCGKVLKYLPNKDARKNNGYCSASCYFKKPPKMAYIEKIYGKPAREVLVELLNKTNNVFVTADMLGVYRQALYRWIDKLKIKRVVRWE